MLHYQLPPVMTEQAPNSHKTGTKFSGHKDQVSPLQRAVWTPW